MKTFALVCWLMAGNVWFARAADVKRFELNGEDTLTVAVSRAMRVQLVPGEDGQSPQLILSDTNRVCEMHVVLVKSNGNLSDDQIKNRLVIDGQRLLSAVVEKEIKVQKFGGSTFTYFYFELTDSRANPVQGGRSIVQGLGRSAGYMCEFVMSTSRKNSDVKAQILSSLRSIDIRPKK